MGVGACALGFAAGVLTAFSPCVLPLLAVTVTTAFQRHRYGPLALAAGLAVSATVLGLVFALVGLALDRDLVRLSAAGLLILVGGVLLSARLQSGLTRLTAPVASTATALASRTAPGGLKGQLVLGALLGAVWSPCAGPTLAAAIGRAAQRLQPRGGAATRDHRLWIARALRPPCRRRRAHRPTADGDRADRGGCPDTLGR